MITRLQAMLIYNIFESVFLGYFISNIINNRDYIISLIFTIAIIIMVGYVNKDVFIKGELIIHD